MTSFPRSVSFPAVVVIALATAVLYLGAADASAADENKTIAIYDVRDLIESPEQDVTNPGYSPEAAARVMKERADSYVAIARERMPRPYAADEPRLEVPSPGMMVLDGTPEQHEWMRGFLDLQRRSAFDLLMVDVQFVEMPEAAFATIFEKEQPRIDLTTEDLRDRVFTLADIDVLTSPRLAVRSGMRATITMANEVPYVKEYEVVEGVEPGGRTIEVPVIATIMDGLRFDGRATLVAESEVNVDFELELNELQRPVEEKSTPLGPIGVPVVMSVEVGSTVTMNLGGTVAFPARHGERRLAIFLHVERIDPERR